MSNTLLQNLGFSADERLAIVHVDDIGMCQASLAAFSDLWSLGAVSSGSVMTPCPWFPAVAKWYAQHRDADLGVHLTLTSEWSTYRWGPVTPSDPADKLTDHSGRYFHATRDAVCRHARADAVNMEMQAQLVLARRFGLQPSHIDSHMLTSLQSRFLADFLQLSISNTLPALVTKENLKQLGSVAANQWEKRLYDKGIPLFKHWLVIKHCSSIDEYNAELHSSISTLSPGLTCILLHPAKDCGELRQIATDWRHRVIEYQALRQKKVWRYAADAGVKIINYKHLLQPDAAIGRPAVSDWKG